MSIDLTNFIPKIWEENLTEIFSENYLLKNCGQLDINVPLDYKKYFAFKVDDVAKAQSDIEVMTRYLKRCKMAIDLVIDCHYMMVIKHSQEIELSYNLKVEEIEIIRLQDSFDSAIKGIVRFGIEPKKQV